MAIKYFDGHDWIEIAGGERGPIGPQGPQGPRGGIGPRGRDGAGINLIKIWENASPAANFTAQTVTPSISGRTFEDYDFFVVEVEIGTSNNRKADCLVRKGSEGFALYIASVGSTQYVYRRGGVITDSSASFDGGYRNGTAGNQYCIPLAIYGLSGLNIDASEETMSEYIGIGENGNWWAWSSTDAAFIDTGIRYQSGGGIDDYQYLDNKPKINGTELVGNTVLQVLPTPTEFDDGKIAKIVNGQWAIAEDLKLSITETSNPEGGNTLTIGG